MTVPDPALEVETSAVLDLRSARAWVAESDGGPVLMLSDGDTQVELSCGLVGRTHLAAQGAERVATSALQLAAMVRAGAGGSGRAPAGARGVGGSPN